MTDRDRHTPSMRTNENLIGRGIAGVAKRDPDRPDGEIDAMTANLGREMDRAERAEAVITELQSENARLRAAIQRALDDEESGDGWGPDNTVCAYLRCALDPTPERVRMLAEFDEANRRNAR